MKQPEEERFMSNNLLLEEAIKKVPQDKYEKFIEQLELESVFLSSVEFERLLDAHLQEISEIRVEMEQNFSFENLPEYNKTFTLSKYTIFGIAANRKIFKLNIEISSEFSFKTIPFDKYIFTIFSNTTLKMITFPYLRAIVSQIIANSGLGLLTLPLLKRLSKTENEI